MNDQSNSGSADATSVYWAAQEGDDFLAEASKRVSDYYSFYGSAGLYERDKRGYMTLYGLSPDGENVSYKTVSGGSSGQLTMVKSNQWANLVEHTTTIVTAKLPSLDAKATNSEQVTADQTKLANNVLEHFKRALNMEEYTREVTKMAVGTRECWLWTRWNSNKGDVYSQDDEGAPVKTGSLEVSMHLCQDVIRDPSCKVPIHDLPWLMVRFFANRYDLAAKFPEHADDIMAVAKSSVDAYRIEFQTWTDNSDLIPVFQFYHAPSDALPGGRQATFLQDSVTLLDGPLGYGGKIPVLPMSPAKISGTPFGYSLMYDLLGLQQVYDALVSGVVTNEITFSVRRLLVPRQAGINSKQLSTDLGVMYYDGEQAPGFLETPLTTHERLEAIQFIRQEMQLLSAINDVIRGNAADAGTKAASGLALLQTQALQFLSGLEFSYANLWRKWGELVLGILRERATAPMMIAIAGKDKQDVLQSFSRDDLANEYRVSVDLGDPMLKTSAGRFQLATMLSQSGYLPQGPEGASAVLQILQTGNLDKVIDEITAEDDLIKRENEALLRGEVPAVSEFDTAEKHFAKHPIVAFSQEARKELQIENSGGPPSKIIGAMEQHMLLHRMNQQKMASIQNAQAATLTQMQAVQAPALPPPGSPAGGHPPPPGIDSPPSVQRAQDPTGAVPPKKLPPLPPGSTPVPGVQ